MSRKFYEFAQTMTGAEYVEDGKVCHRVFVEADTVDEACRKAETLGIYFDGVSKGIDPTCTGNWINPDAEDDDWQDCGNRWNRDCVEYGENSFPMEMEVSCAHKDEWEPCYGSYELIEAPTENGCGLCGKIRVHSIEEYVQALADTESVTFPEARIYYADGTVREFTDSREDD